MGEKLNAISLFSGIGGFELGLVDYCRTVLYCEADPHAQAVLLSRMHEGKIDIAPICTDVREIKGEFIDTPIDIIMGGFPCQDISCAGKGVGLEGKRSGLFFEIVRLAEEIKPTFLFLENVSAIRTRGLDRVIWELTEIGYDSRWCMLSASDVGAKHKRERWFLLAYSKSNDGRRRLSDLFDENATQQRSQNEYQDQTWEFSDSSNHIRILANTECERSVQCKHEGQPRYQKGISSRNGSNVSNTESSRAQRLRSCGEQKPDLSNGEKILGCNSENCGNKRAIKSNMGGVVDGVSFDVVKSRLEYIDPTYWQEEPENVPRVTEEKEQRVERIKRLGNAVVPLQVKTAFEYLFGILDYQNNLKGKQFYQKFEYDNAFE